jgi:hypothetical protein
MLNAGFFVFWLYPWQGGGKMDSSSRHIAGGPFPETRSQAAATQPGLVTQAVEKQGNTQNQPETAMNLPASDGARVVPQVPEGETKAEQRSPETAVQTANPVESQKITAANPSVDGTQSNSKTAPDQVVETKIPSENQGAVQNPKTQAVPADPAPPVRPPASPPGASKTTAAVAKNPSGPKMQQTAKAAGTKQGLKTAKSETVVRNPPVPVEQSFPPEASSGIISDLKGLAKPAERKEPKWHELAPQVRDALPGMSVSMLVYSKKREERWININGTKRKEGQEISAGLKVEEITPDGAVFSYQGQRFYKGVVGD